MYRILHEQGQSGERRRHATHHHQGGRTGKGVWHHAYVVIDIFNRYIVERAEWSVRAEELIRESIARNGIGPQTMHADCGTSMTSKKVSPEQESGQRTERFLSDSQMNIIRMNSAPLASPCTHSSL